MENKRIAVLPIVETPENWEGEIHAGYALEYAPEGYVSVYSVEDFVSAGDKVYLFPKQKPGKGGIVGKRLMKYYVSSQTKPFPVDMRLKWLS